MPKTPKVFRKKSKVKTWFNRLAKEVLIGEDLPVQEQRVATGYTVANFQGYSSLPSDDSGSEVEMEGPSHPAMDGLGEMRQQFQLLQAQSATPETQDPIGRVVAVLERPKVEDSQEFFESWLKAEKAAGRADRQTFRDMSRAEAE